MKGFFISLAVFAVFWVDMTNAQVNYSGSDTTLFDNGEWVVSGATDTGPNTLNIRIFVEGQFVGEYSEIKVSHVIQVLGFPQIFSVKGKNAALRPALPPPGEFGGTFYPTGYWDCDSGFVQNMQIIELDIHLNSTDTTILELQGEASNLSSFEAPDFFLRFLSPTLDSVTVEVSYNLIATRNFCIDPMRQGQHEGFRIARIASNFIDFQKHESDQARYVDSLLIEICDSLRNETGFIFTNPLPMGEPEMYLIHSDMKPRNTPTLLIKFFEPPPQRITPQGYVTFSLDPTDDNVDFWGNWDGAELTHTTGDTIGSFIYTLVAIPPSPICGITRVTEIKTMPINYLLEQNYPNPFNPSTIIRYQLSEVTDVELTIFNTLGQKVRTLVNKKQIAGTYQIYWDGRNEKGIQMPSGVYLYRLNAGSFIKTRKMLLIR